MSPFFSSPATPPTSSPPRGRFPLPPFPSLADRSTAQERDAIRYRIRDFTTYPYRTVPYRSCLNSQPVCEQERETDIRHRVPLKDTGRAHSLSSCSILLDASLAFPS